MNQTQPQLDTAQTLEASNSYLKEAYSTKLVENIATNMDLQNGYVILKNLKNIPTNSNNKLNNNNEKKVVKYPRCFTRSPSNVGLSLSRPSRPSLPPNMKFTPPNQKLEQSNIRNNNNAIQEGKNQIFSSEMLSGQVLFVYNS
ncbi:hypothetical protein M9Y10_012691 [Tritrichomonas musculus]|uniref:Uncharacterized protein n=1 Tax=Tritrichomonas musculus TaxID=1915356 RepID=A0ABR2ID79_9EUKA